MIGDETTSMETEGTDDEFLETGSNPKILPKQFHLALVGSESLVLPLRQKLKEGLER